MDTVRFQPKDASFLSSLLGLSFRPGVLKFDFWALTSYIVSKASLINNCRAKHMETLQLGHRGRLIRRKTVNLIPT